MTVEGRAQRQQQQRREAGQRAADAAAKPPRHTQADDADDGAEQAAGFKQFEWNDLVQKGGRHVETAAIHIEIGERERAGVPEPGTVHLEQEVGIFGVGVVVPAQSVITKGETRDQGNSAQHDEREIIAGPFNRAPRWRIDGRSGDR